MNRINSTTLVVAATLALAACGEESPTESVMPGPSFSVTDPAPGEVVLCKYTEGITTTADFTVSATAGTVNDASPSLDAIFDLVPTTDCAVVWTSGGASATVTITEAESGSLSLYRIFVEGAPHSVDLAGRTVDIDATPSTTVVAFFKNEVDEGGSIPGRMTGGGGQIAVGDVNITRGFTIHCDIELSNNLQIVWHDDTDQWHIDKPLTSALCVDDGDPTPPAAPFNTFIGEGVGRLNGVDGSIVRFVFIDNGEPGRNDQAAIAIWAPGADPDLDDPVKEVALTNLDRGNIQAHYDQPHGQGRGR